MKVRILDPVFVSDDTERNWKRGDIIELGKKQGQEAIKKGFVKELKKEKTKTPKKTVPQKSAKPEPMPYAGKGPLRVKFNLEKEKEIRDMLAISKEYNLCNYARVSEAEYYDLKSAGLAALSEGEQKARLKTKAKETMPGNPMIYFNGTAFISKRLGDSILEQEHIKTLIGNGRMYFYGAGVYQEGAKEKIDSHCAKALEEKYTTHYSNETANYIKSKTYIPADAIDNGWINLQNGLLNPETKEFKQHTPDIFSTVQIPVEYDSKAECPTWKEKLQDKIDKPTKDVLQEFFGYTFQPGQKYQKGLLLHGAERTMKSTALNVLEKLIGKENSTAFSLQRLNEDKYANAYLYGKPLNVCADLESRGLKSTGSFMMITGGDKISAGKKHEHPIHFYPTTKLIFSCNDIPATQNKTLAFYRRWIILSFDKQTSENDVDEELPEAFEKELPGILNWALEGLARLNGNKGFSYWLGDKEIKDLYEKSSDSIQSFIYNQIDCEDSEGIIQKRVVYKAYKKYCQEEKIRLENQIKFGKDFISLTGCGTCQEKKIPAYRGVNWHDKPSQGGLHDSY